MNVEPQRKDEPSIYGYVSKQYKNYDYSFNSPLDSIQNRPNTSVSTADIDKKIDEIRKKYQDYQVNPSYAYSTKYTTTISNTD